MEYLELVLQLVAGLVGFPAFLAAAINVLKYFKVLQDGQAPTANVIGHLITYGGVGILVLLGKVDILPGLDLKLGLVANILLTVLAFLTSVTTTVRVHWRMVESAVPVIGYTHPYQPYNSEVDLQ
jgi:hypothetical protein